jgi:hypothetical protein
MMSFDYSSTLQLIYAHSTVPFVYLFVYICLVVEALLFGRQVDTVPCGRVPPVPLTRYRGPTELVQHSAHVGARALIVI